MPYDNVAGNTVTSLHKLLLGMDLRLEANRCQQSIPVAQWIEQSPPKGQVGRSIRLLGASRLNGLQALRGYTGRLIIIRKCARGI